MSVRLPEITDSPSYWQELSAMHGRVAFDIGANTGQAARLLAPNFVHVYSFEPCHEAAAVLIVETPVNVVVSPLAVTDHEGNVTLDVTEHSITTGQLTTGSRLGWGPVVGQRTLPATTVDQIVDRYKADPDLVKIDTEGHEVYVLRGAKGTIGRRHATWMIEVHDRLFEEPIRELLAGYRVVRRDHDYLSGTDRDDHFYLIGTP